MGLRVRALPSGEELGRATTRPCAKTDFLEVCLFPFPCAHVAGVVESVTVIGDTP